jgi:hypothetical protein
MGLNAASDMQPLETLPELLDEGPVSPLVALEQQGLMYKTETLACMPDLGPISNDEDNEEEEEACNIQDPEWGDPLDNDLLNPHKSMVLDEVDGPQINNFCLCEPIPANPCYPNENNFNLFYKPLVICSQGSICIGQTPNPIYLLYVMVAWLHMQCKVVFKACNAVLVVVIYILALAGTVDLSNRRVVYLSLSLVLNNLDVKLDVRVLCICPNYQEPYPAYWPGPFLCNQCHTPVFAETLSNNPRKRNAHPIVKPVLQCPHISIESQL